MRSSRSETRACQHQGHLSLSSSWHTYDQTDDSIIQLLVEIPGSLHELKEPIDKVVGETLCESTITPRESLALSCNMGLLVTDLVLPH